MISGGVISGYNIIDPFRIVDETKRGIIIVTYQESAGIEDDIVHHFPGDRARIAAYRNLAAGFGITPNRAMPLYEVVWIKRKRCRSVCSDCTYDGRVPEPLRVARLYARSVMRSDTIR